MTELSQKNVCLLVYLFSVTRASYNKSIWAYIKNRNANKKTGTLLINTAQLFVLVCEHCDH